MFNLRAARIARDAGIQEADSHAHAVWKSYAMKAVEILALHRPEFTSDAVVRALDAMLVPPTHEMRALGGIMQRAQRQGWIEPTDRFEFSERVSRHHAPLRVWRSLICQQGRLPL